MATKRDFIPLDSIDGLLLNEDESFEEYLFFHNVLDKFCWLIKLHYADRETVRRKRYRLDTLFQWYLRTNRLSPVAAKKSLTATMSPDQLEHNLTKGWHNELVRSDPLHAEYLQVGTNIGNWAGPGSGGLAAWNVVQTYYAVFEFLSAVVSAYNPDLRIDGHKKLAREFNNHVQGKLAGFLLFYPLTISSVTTDRAFPEHPAHTKFHYATYPRAVGTSIDQLEKLVRDAFALAGEGRRTSILDFLYELRLWANYTGVGRLLKLRDGGYQAFLMKNLGTVVFFAGGIAELTYISLFGQSRYAALVQKFAREYIDRSERFARQKYLIPIYVRLRAYKHVGILTGSLRFVFPDTEDPIQFIPRDA